MAIVATPTSTTARRVGLAALSAAAANTVIALVTSALNEGHVATGLSPAFYLPLTIAGFAIGAIGWTVIVRRARRALRVIVPVALVLTWIPDMVLLMTGATVVNVVGLMLMHIVVATSVVTALHTSGPVDQATGSR